MKTWDEMEPRERDNWVAQNVMGWTLACRRQMGWGDGPDVWLTAGEDIDNPNSNPTHQEPKFTTDASADYLALKRVRETWDDFGGKRLDAFVTALEEIWGMSHWGEANPIAYQPGDYSHAAYLALTATDSAKGDA